MMCFGFCWHNMSLHLHILNFEQLKKCIQMDRCVCFSIIKLVRLETTFHRISFLVLLWLKVSQKGSLHDMSQKWKGWPFSPQRFSVCDKAQWGMITEGLVYSSLSWLFHSVPSLPPDSWAPLSSASDDC